MSRPELPPSDPLRERLERAASGLVYSSEGDHPFEFFAVDASGSADSSAEALAPLLLPEYRPGDRIEERTLDQFLGRHIERVDPFDRESLGLRPRYEALRKELRSALAAPRVVRVTRASDRAVVRCFIVGRERDGRRLAGLATSAIET